MTHTILLDGKLCPKCKTPLAEARGIGPYCPNAKCDIIDNIAPVKEEKLCKSPTCGDHTDHFRGEGRCEARQPVPSEQENQEELQKEIFDVSLKYTRDPAFLGWLFNTFNFTRK